MPLATPSWRSLGLCASLGLAGLAVAPAARADEGMWTPDQLKDLDATKLRSMGLELEARELWSDAGGGLMRAAINLSGCSAAFVSDRGLIATNHHCAYRAIQANSSVNEDRLAKGFLAKAPKDELKADGYTVQIPRSVRDVTKEVLNAAKGAKNDAERYASIELAKKTLVAECEKRPAARCSVASFYLGKQFKLFEALELRDIRLVYAPPAAIGEYGGEVDNWMWPRHTGDFALLRAYATPKQAPAEYAADNVPYKPKVWLRLGAEGVAPGDFVAVLGYPGQTQRYLDAVEIERTVEQVLPAIVDLYGEWIDVLEQEGRRDKDVALKVAAQKKGLANRHKNARGMLAGILRMRLQERKQDEADRIKEALRSRDHDNERRALADLAQLAVERKRDFPRHFLLENASRGPALLAVAIDLLRRAHEAEKPDLEREAGYMDRDADRLWQLQERRIKNQVASVDTRLLASLALRAKQLPEDKSIGALGKLAGAGDDPVKLANLLKTRFNRSKLTDPAYAKKLFDEHDAGALDKLNDPWVQLARGLLPELQAKDAEEHRRSGVELRVGATFFTVLSRVRKGPVYPDANGTLRVSLASVKGYEPSDALIAKPQTTLSGAIEKHTGTPPFDLPEALRKAAGPRSYWTDPALRDVALCFLSNADTTGGNSGSPVINGRGELVGLNFDRVWENIAGDYGYSVERSRNISVDVRYMLFLLDRVDNASALLRELGAARFRSAPARSDRPGRPRRRPDVETPSPKSKGCALSRDPVGGSGSLVGLAGLWLLALRRRTKRRKAR